jgi:hypothetical protein
MQNRGATVREEESDCAGTRGRYGPGTAVDLPPGHWSRLAGYGLTKTGWPTPKNRFSVTVADTLPLTPSQIP